MPSVMEGQVCFFIFYFFFGQVCIFIFNFLSVRCAFFILLSFYFFIGQVCILFIILKISFSVRCAFFIFKFEFSLILFRCAWRKPLDTSMKHRWVKLWWFMDVFEIVVVVVVVYGKLLVFTSKHFCRKCVSAQFSGGWCGNIETKIELDLVRLWWSFLCSLLSSDHLVFVILFVVSLFVCLLFVVCCLFVCLFVFTLYHLLQVPRRIFETNNATKLVLIVRNPVDRLVSDYNQFRSRKLDRWFFSSSVKRALSKTQNSLAI